MLQKLIKKPAPSRKVDILVISSADALRQGALAIDSIWQPSWSQASLVESIAMAINPNRKASTLDTAIHRYLAAGNNLPETNWAPMTIYEFSHQSMMSGGAWHYGREYKLAVIGDISAVSNICDLTEAEREQINQKATTAMLGGFQVAAVASGSLQNPPMSLQNITQKDKLTFAGLVIFIDKPNLKSKSAIGSVSKADVLVKLITGSHPEAAFYIASKLNLVKSRGQVLSSQNLNYMSAAEKDEAVNSAVIFAGADEKRRQSIISLLQKHYATIVVDNAADLLEFTRTLPKSQR